LRPSELQAAPRTFRPPHLALTRTLTLTRNLTLTRILTLTRTLTRTLTLTLTKAALHTCRTPHAAHLCPADDGGYVLLGVPRELFTSPARDAARASLFQAVRWSSSDTCTSQVSK